MDYKVLYCDRCGELVGFSSSGTGDVLCSTCMEKMEKVRKVSQISLPLKSPAEDTLVEIRSLAEAG